MPHYIKQAKMINFISVGYHDQDDADMKAGRPPKSERSHFGERLQFLRENAQLTQREVAAAMGISQPSYAAWERRDIGLTPAQLQKLAGVLGVDVVDFFSNDMTPKRNGPVGRARKTLEAVSRLPRSRQKHILDVIDVLLPTDHNSHSQAA